MLYPLTLLVIISLCTKGERKFCTDFITFSRQDSSVLACSQFAMSLMQNHRVTLLQIYFVVKFFNHCVELFVEIFPDAPIPDKSTVYDLVQCFGDTRSVNDRSRKC